MPKSPAKCWSEGIFFFHILMRNGGSNSRLFYIGRRPLHLQCSGRMNSLSGYHPPWPGQELPLLFLVLRTPSFDAAGRHYAPA